MVTLRGFSGGTADVIEAVVLVAFIFLMGLALGVLVSTLFGQGKNGSGHD
jgi:hypothetical protein